MSSAAVVIGALRVKGQNLLLLPGIFPDPGNSADRSVFLLADQIKLQIRRGNRDNLDNNLYFSIKPYFVTQH